MTTTQTRPNLTEEQAARAIAEVFRGPEDIKRKMLADWRTNAAGARFMVHAMYYGLANYKGRGIA